MLSSQQSFCQANCLACYPAGMNDRQRELVSKTLADVGKGLLLAIAVATMTDKAGPLYVGIYFFLSVYAFAAAYRLEGHSDDSDQSV
ncbi:MAG: hypothetical protein HQL82_15915 [Magnetococcales bacterium]|nr:hypothetical protein [Magnetococcales bacterium]